MGFDKEEYMYTPNMDKKSVKKIIWLNMSNSIWRIKINAVLQCLSGYFNVVRFIRRGRQSWIRHMESMEESEIP